jgi:hypothetical protein
VDIAAKISSVQSPWQAQRAPLWCALTHATLHLRLANSGVAAFATRQSVLPLCASVVVAIACKRHTETMMRTTCHLLMAVALVMVTHAQADVPWSSVHRAELRAIFVDHELADGVHYAYQFRGGCASVSPRGRCGST